MQFFNKKSFERIYLLKLTFVSGMCIMAAELSASRLLAPYFGTSTFVWTNVIGIIMVGLSAGYYVGGKLADAFPRLDIITRIVGGGAIYLLTTPFVARAVAESIHAHLVIFILVPIAILVSAVIGIVFYRIIRRWVLPVFISLSICIAILAFTGEKLTTLLNATSFVAPYLFWGSAVAVSILFVIPITLMGMTGPFVIKLLSLTDDRVGNDAGTVFAVSTIGSILGTFLPVLVFIPWIGTRKTIVLFAALLFITASFGYFKNTWMRIVPVVLIGLLLIPLPLYKEAAGMVAEKESAYQYMQVIDEGGMRYLKVNEGLGVFSVLNLRGPLTGRYFDFFTLLPYFVEQKKEPLEILILGVAGGTISTQMNQVLASQFKFNVDGVDIDPAILNLARAWFGISYPNVQLHVADAREFLRRTDKRYDLIIVDAYAQQLYIPFHLTTKEFFQEVNRHLNPGGIVAMNVNASSDESKLLNAITNTLYTSFTAVYAYSDLLWSWNYLLIAAQHDIAFPSLYASTDFGVLQTTMDRFYDYVAPWPLRPEFGILTDDRAPVEYMTDAMIVSAVFNSEK